MYLATLSLEQKQLFMEFAYRLACIDGEYSNMEVMTMDVYRQETGIEFDENSVTRSADEIISRLAEVCDARELRIIVFEMMGLALADGKYDEKEKRLFSDMMVRFGLDAGFANDCKKVLEDYFVLQNRINEIVLG